MRSLISCSTMTRLLLLFSIPASLLIDPICGQPHGSPPHHQNRRSPEWGFQGVRGKRDINNIGSTDYYLEATTANNSTAANSLSPPPPPPPLPSSSEQLMELPAEPRNFIGGLPALSLTKRAPVGFFGMRGKKDELMEATLPFSEQQQLDQSEGPAQGGDDGEESDGYEEELQQKSDLQAPRNKKLFFNLPYRFIPKRAPSGFMGMRGKKLFYDGSYKRGPVGFMGMRGKKALYPSPLLAALLARNYEIDDVEDDSTGFPALGQFNDYQDVYESGDNYEKRGPASGFFGMRGKKWDDAAGEFAQRNPAANFFGMRGKKEYESEMNDMDKRAPANGFFGMRGKKWDDVVEEFEKRTPASNFFGMRGKKQYGSPINDLDNEKRAPKMGFHGMRGKRSPDYFSVMRRAPYEFRGKFVGVRGKKNASSSLFNYLSAADVQDVEAQQRTQFEKRAPNGFFGMRGKKS